MTISAVSPSSGGNLLGALSGTTGTAEGDTGNGSFSGLFAQLLGGRQIGEQGQIQILGELPIAATDPGITTAATGLQDFLSQLPEEIQALLRDKKQGKENERQEDNDGQGLLGALQTPITPTSIPATPDADAGQGRIASLTANAAQSLSGQSAALPGPLQEELTLSQGAGSANLAAGPEDFSQLLHSSAVHSNTSPQTAPAQAAARPEGLNTPVQDSRWSQEFGEKIVWMARNDQQQAQLSLNPAHLGPLQITLSLDSDQASANFTAATPEVRQAIEDALPRLREMLASAGISLGQTQVGTQAQQEQAQERQDRAGTRSQGDEAILEVSSGSASSVLPQRGNGLVDLFA
ncbi:flagellar hook-length control protein FliK [Azovibrio restrictus]|uniref:flagellar hook-length control protein FliK n=1 Tax=Azovibrio restrictus TaxID=146938 RepID=UPI0026EC9675|nr:flagellar hook-length control protein FliK [Azovibrio restrictus]MDD3481942.1 flagellar hook-length control protein FliK [Azovibrio restrictus]